jgi:hypothetical protein
MTFKLKDAKITHISLVDKGANGYRSPRRFGGSEEAGVDRRPEGTGRRRCAGC